LKYFALQLASSRNGFEIAEKFGMNLPFYVNNPNMLADSPGVVDCCNSSSL
jgi:hypothetical protein